MGEVALVPLFLGSGWPPHERRRRHRDLRRACTWLEQQATASGVPLRIHTRPARDLLLPNLLAVAVSPGEAETEAGKAAMIVHRSIMCRPEAPLATRVIDPITARAIG